MLTVDSHHIFQEMHAYKGDLWHRYTLSKGHRYRDTGQQGHGIAYLTCKHHIIHRKRALYVSSVQRWTVYQYTDVALQIYI